LGFSAFVALVWGMAESALCPAAVAGSRSCRAAGGRESVWQEGIAQLVRMVAFLCGVISRGGRGRGRSSQPYLGPRGCGFCPGDMMIDRCDVR